MRAGGAKQLLCGKRCRISDVADPLWRGMNSSHYSLPSGSKSNCLFLLCLEPKTLPSSLVYLRHSFEVKQKADGHKFTKTAKTAVRPFPYVPTKALEEEEADEYGSYGYAASPSLGEAARSIPKPLMPPLPTETHSTGAIAASSIPFLPGMSS